MMATDADRARYRRWYEAQAAKGRNTANRITWRSNADAQFVPPPSNAAPRRTYIPQGEYTPPPWDTWRPGQDEFKRVPSIGMT